MKNESKNTISRKVQNIGLFLNKHSVHMFVLLMVAAAAGSTVFAAAGVDTLWTTLSNTIKTWVTRLGGVVMFVGGVQFGLGWKNDDASQKTSGLSTIMAGGIVVAVAALTATFFK